MPKPVYRPAHVLKERHISVSLLAQLLDDLLTAADENPQVRDLLNHWAAKHRSEIIHTCPIKWPKT